MNEVESPFRVTLDPPIGSLNQLLSIKLNWIVQSSLSQFKAGKSDGMDRMAFDELYRNSVQSATQEMANLMHCLYHCKRQFAVIYDVVSQVNQLKDEQEVTVLFKGPG